MIPNLGSWTVVEMRTGEAVCDVNNNALYLPVDSYKEHDVAKILSFK